MNFTSICIFIVICLIYIYIIDQYKTNNDLEIYEMDYINNIHLQEVCGLRQPILFYFLPTDPIFLLKDGSHMEVNVKDTHNYFTNSMDIDPVSVSYDCANQLCLNDSNSHFFSEDNGEFLENMGLIKHISNYNQLLAPMYYTIHTEYDYLFGSSNVMTPLRYHTYYRRFLFVLSGKIRIKMASWKNTESFKRIKDYENYDFRSSISPKEIFLNKQIKFLDVEVSNGSIIYIPPYMWYSIQYLDVTSRILSISHITLMNAISNTHHLGLYWLQHHNIVKISTVNQKKEEEDDDELDIVLTPEENNLLIEDSNETII